MVTRIFSILALVALAFVGYLASEGRLQPLVDSVTALLAPAAERAKGAGGGGMPAGPPMPVTVSQPLQRNDVEWDDSTGRVDAVQSVEIRARVNGYLTEVRFKDGQDVKAGDILFIIDPRPYERAVAQAQAELDQARVKVSNASLDVERGRPLADRNVISQKTLDDRENLQREAESLVKVAEAKLKLAELDLGFTRVVAPISGRIGRAIVTIGNYVSGGGSQSATLLTTIVTQDPVYVYFDVSETNALKYRRLGDAGKGAGATALLDTPVYVGLQDEQGFPGKGRLDFTDNRLDTGTGTLRARAVLDNRAGILAPGMFARVRLAGSGEYAALLLPDEAIGTDQPSRYVLVVGDDGQATRRGVKLGPLFDGLRIVRAGVAAEDWVVVRGQARIRPGQKVEPKREALKVSDADGAVRAPAGPTATSKP